MEVLDIETGFSCEDNSEEKNHPQSTKQNKKRATNVFVSRKTLGVKTMRLSPAFSPICTSRVRLLHQYPWHLHRTKSRSEAQHLQDVNVITNYDERRPKHNTAAIAQLTNLAQE